MGQILDFSAPIGPRRQPGQQRSAGYEFRYQTNRGQPGFISLDVFDGPKFIGFVTCERVHGDFAAWSWDRASIIACPDLETALATVRAMDQRGRQ
ncbi:hypothetical protein MKK75_17555 [Methylobacterium sp. J-030]|uniref:hypothetical protein n=1 Tax=Methylobacterium sp. J-030 TaxID=2836627 RepID=UPI001FBA6ED5|nr:hypothetical protein [Methylobacterium sp. J-030]MCJ2070578.1 hypothetical protein [Methylobacterium sp. J-030]